MGKRGGATMCSVDYEVLDSSISDSYLPAVILDCPRRPRSTFKLPS